MFCFEQFIQIEFATAAITQSKLRTVAEKNVENAEIFVRFTALDGDGDGDGVSRC